MIFLMIIISFLLVSIVYLVFLMIFYKYEKFFETMSCYECGFEPNSFTRMVFSYRFFLISILFIIFDVEISLMLPIPYLMMNFVSLFIFFLFVMILLVGLLYEYYYGSLEWLNYYKM